MSGDYIAVFQIIAFWSNGLGSNPHQNLLTHWNTAQKSSSNERPSANLLSTKPSIKHLPQEHLLALVVLWITVYMCTLWYTFGRAGDYILLYSNRWSILWCTAHIEPIAKLSQKFVLKSLHRFRTTAGVIMGLIHLCSLLSSLDVSRLRSDGPVSHLASTDY